jgi:hypothetical protein
MKLYIDLCFHYVEERLPNFYQILKSIQELKTEKTELIVTSNINFDSSLPIDVVKLEDPYRLVWEHKRYMVDFLKTDFTHQAHIEANVLVTQQTFDYWFRTRELFKRNNLNFIPAIHRVEKNNAGMWMTLDTTEPVVGRPIIEVEGKRFISLLRPHQGMHIMDRELVEEHERSRYFHYSLPAGYGGYVEASAVGNMFENVPAGFEHRMMTPLENFPETWVHHLTNNYTNNLNSIHGKIPVESLLNGYN